MPIRIPGCSILRSSEESSKVNINVLAYRSVEWEAARCVTAPASLIRLGPPTTKCSPERTGCPMTNDEYVALLKQGVDAWNTWRDENFVIRPDLSQMKLSATSLRG
jgi:hypothetical protein